MTLRSRLIGTQLLQVGDTVGYGSSFTAERAMRIGVVACGYADGYPRSATTGTPVLVNGVRTQMVGRVSMDMITVDLTPVPITHAGTEVTLWGRGPHGTQLPIDEVARAAGTVGYELMCALAPRVPVRAEAPRVSARPAPQSPGARHSPLSFEHHTRADVRARRWLRLHVFLVGA